MFNYNFDIRALVPSEDAFPTETKFDPKHLSISPNILATVGAEQMAEKAVWLNIICKGCDTFPHTFADNLECVNGVRLAKEGNMRNVWHFAGDDTERDPYRDHNSWLMKEPLDNIKAIRYYDVGFVYDAMFARIGGKFVPIFDNEGFNKLEANDYFVCPLYTETITYAPTFAKKYNEYLDKVFRGKMKMYNI